MSRYEVVFSARALVSLREGDSVHRRGRPGQTGPPDWLAKVRHSTLTLETHPYAFPLVGEFEAEHIRARSVMRHIVYYFVDESANTVTVVDVVHSARETERARYERGRS